MNYETLYNSIQSYAENTEQLFVANIPVFVQEAEERIYNSVQIPSLRKNLVGSFTSGNQYISLPDDWLANYSLAVIDSSNNYKYLLNKDVNFLREAYPTVANNGTTYQGTPGGVPEYYALFGSQLSNVNEMTLMVAPTPDASYTVEMHYYYYPPTISYAKYYLGIGRIGLQIKPEANCEIGSICPCATNILRCSISCRIC